MKPAISLKHAEFIRLVANGETLKQAYKTSIGKKKTSNVTAESRGSKLAKQYAVQIAEERKRQSDLINEQKDQTIKNDVAKKILTQSDVDVKLCEIITNKTVDGKPVAISHKLKAIEIYNKRFGSNEPEQNDVNINMPNMSNMSYEQLLQLSGFNKK